MKTRTFGAGILYLTFVCAGQDSSNKPQPQQHSLTQQNPPVVPDMYQLGRRAGITDEDHNRLNKVEERVDDIRGTISWMRGAWWILGGVIIVIGAIIRFFGSSLFVAVEDRMERARTKASGS